MSTNDNDPTDDPITTTRRETMAAGASFPLAFWDDWSIFGEEENTEYELLRILNAEEPVSEGITQLDFGDNLSVEQTAEDGVRIDAAASGSGATKLDDLDNVDVTGWLEGTFADRPSTGNVPAGTRYWATDRDTAYRNTTNGWDVNGGTGTASDPIPEQHVGSFSTGNIQSSINSGQYQSAIDGLVVPIAPNLGVGDSIDPSSTTTPIQDANDVIANAGNGGGTILLPPTEVEEATSPVIDTGINIKGWGTKWGATVGTSGLHVTGTGEPVITLDGAVTNGKHEFDGFYLRGQGVTATEHAGIRVVNGGGGVSDVDVGTLLFVDIHGPAIEALDPLFQSHFGRLIIQNVDAGDTSYPYLCYFSSGPGITIDNFVAYPVADSSAANSRVLYTGSSDVTIDSMNLGGTCGEVLRPGSGSAFGTKIGQVNYEPGNQQSTPTALFRPRSRHDRIEKVVINGASGTVNVSNVYLVDNGGSYLGNPSVKDGASIGSDVVQVNSDLATPAIFEGKSVDVNNATGATLTEPVSCLGDQTLVT